MRTLALALAISVGCGLLVMSHAAAQNVPAVAPTDQTGALYRSCVDAQNVREALREGRLPGNESNQVQLATAVGRCEGYIQGFLDGNQFGRSPEFQFCIPESVTLGQIYAVFREYGREHPEQHHWPMSWGLNSALYEAFPCPGAR